MTTPDLVAVVNGGAAASRRILQNCRFSGCGSEAYGGEDIRAMLRSAGLNAEASCIWASASASAAAFVGRDGGGAPLAAFADVNEGWITRLWLASGHRLPIPARPRISVPQDPDCDQRGASTGFDRADFPLLSDSAAGRLSDALGDLPSDAALAALPLARLRAVVLRGFGTASGWAGLLALSGAVPGGRADVFAIIGAHDDAPWTLVPDEAGARAELAAGWTPAARA